MPQQAPGISSLSFLQQPTQTPLESSTRQLWEGANGGSRDPQESAAEFTAQLGRWAGDDAPRKRVLWAQPHTQHRGLPRARTGVPKGAAYQEGAEHVEADEIEVGEACAAGVLLALSKVGLGVTQLAVAAGQQDLLPSLAGRTPGERGCPLVPARPGHELGTQGGLRGMGSHWERSGQDPGLAVLL